MEFSLFTINGFDAEPFDKENPNHAGHNRTADDAWKRNILNAEPTDDLLYAFSFAVNSGEVLNSEIYCRSFMINSELAVLQKTPLILKSNGVH